ncbi:MAG TPA: hypothetical protein VN667_18030 [Burkholderiales bacterium]|nr:hypothetical protein [Burkholderiales bacterium]
MTPYDRFELKWASLIVGVVLWIMAAVALWPNPREPVYAALEAVGMNEPWAAIMVVLGAMIVYGSVRPKRTCRQMGLALAPFILLAVFGVAMGARGLSMSALLVLFFAVLAPVLMIVDTFTHIRDRNV